ncbi:hypothetical protein LTR70_002795 [Exophiala xenobiotica]|uniref:Uncharacterized protein n=1 Tax=Lithohypha guttulata TaxID=1690604 RepID=A0ABR0KJY4_9EURO|nr:hypothetical protein LTR24_002009 [Lithohypha guttulata]KAK5324511.1 hypothetical protein LTR70_002795 [Exophiala xenobiotica]
MKSLRVLERSKSQADYPENNDQGFWRIDVDNSITSWHMCNNIFFFKSMQPPRIPVSFQGYQVLGIGDAVIHVENINEGRHCRKITLKNARYIPECEVESVMCLNYHWWSGNASTKKGGYVEGGIGEDSYLYDDKDRPVAAVEFWEDDRIQEGHIEDDDGEDDDGENDSWWDDDGDDDGWLDNDIQLKVCEEPHRH